MAYRGSIAVPMVFFSIIGKNMWKTNFYARQNDTHGLYAIWTQFPIPEGPFNNLPGGIYLIPIFLALIVPDRDVVEYMILYQKISKKFCVWYLKKHP